MEAPPGYVIDFAHPQRKGLSIGYWVSGVGLVLSFIFLSMRVYIKAGIARNFNLADKCYVLAWLFGVAVQAILIHLWRVGAQGVHVYEIPLERYNYYNVMIMTASVLYVPCLALAKFSLLLFYHQLSPIRWFKMAVYILMAVVVGYSFAIIFTLIFPCNPIAKNWDITITKGTCINRAAIYIATAVVNIATDVMLLILPIPMIFHLQMPTMQKVGVVFIFTLGSLTCITSVVRLIGILPMMVNPDQTWAVSIPCVWICVEANLVIICGSLPTLRLFFRHVAPRFIGEYGGGNSNSQSWRKNSGLQTISNKRKNLSFNLTYGRMGDGDDDLEMNTNWVVSQKRDESADNDESSEKAILQTKTTTVEYSVKPTREGARES